jgi:hypothetical protein
MLKIKDWLKNRSGRQFIPSTIIPELLKIDTAIRIKDRKVFSLLAFHEGDSTDFYYHTESDNTLKQEIGIYHFHEDNIHVDIVCHSRFIELGPSMQETDVLHAIPIDDIEPYYHLMFSKGKKIMLERISQELTN